MPLVLFAAPDARTLLEGAGATAAAFAGRGWRCVASAGDLQAEAAEILGLAPTAGEETADLVFFSEALADAFSPSRSFAFGGPLALRVHEGLDAKIAALEAQRGRAFSDDEARSVIEDAIACGETAGAERFTPASPAAEARLARYLRQEAA